MTGELKPLPCPFCGEGAELATFTMSSRQGDAAGWFVRCVSCQSMSEQFEVFGEMPDRNEYTQQKALTAWNTRPREEALEAEVVALRAQVRAASEAAQVVWSGEHARLEAALRPFLALARAVTVDGSPDFVSWAQEAKDWTVAFSFAGHSISLGDLRALAALRWTQGEGE